MDDVYSELRDDRNEQRRKDDDERPSFEEHTADEQHDVENNQHNVFVLRNAEQPRRHRLRDTLPIQIITEHRRRNDDKDDRARSVYRLQDDRNDVFFFQFFV